MKVLGLEGLSDDLIKFELGRGAKFIVFEYCISILYITFKRPSNIYFIRIGEDTFWKSIRYILVSFFLGWWGFPWGPIWTIRSIITNLSGGKDITQEILQGILENAETEEKRIKSIKKASQEWEGVPGMDHIKETLELEKDQGDYKPAE